MVLALWHSGYCLVLKRKNVQDRILNSPCLLRAYNQVGQAYNSNILWIRPVCDSSWFSDFKIASSGVRFFSMGWRCCILRQVKSCWNLYHDDFWSMQMYYILTNFIKNKLQDKEVPSQTLEYVIKKKMSLFISRCHGIFYGLLYPGSQTSSTEKSQSNFFLKHLKAFWAVTIMQRPLVLVSVVFLSYN